MPGIRTVGRRPRFMDDARWMGRFRLRRWRRRTVAALALAHAATGAGALAAVRDAAPWLWIAGAAGTLVAGVVLHLATRNLSNAIDAWADERDRAVRDRWTRIAYWTLGFPLGAVIGAGVALVEDALREPPHRVVLEAADVPWLAFWGWTMFVIYSVLPAALIGWTEPDPIDDDEEEPRR